MKAKVVKRHLSAVAEDRWEDYADTLADNVIYTEHPTLQRTEGKPAMIAVVQLWKRAFPDLKATIQEILSSEDKVVVQLQWEGTQSGPFKSPAAEIPPTGKHGMIAAVEVFTVKKGKIVEIEHYFDLTTVLLQLGVVPHFEIGAAAQPAVH